MLVYRTLKACFFSLWQDYATILVKKELRPLLKFCKLNPVPARSTHCAPNESSYRLQLQSLFDELIAVLGPRGVRGLQLDEGHAHT